MRDIMGPLSASSFFYFLFFFIFYFLLESRLGSPPYPNRRQYMNASSQLNSLLFFFLLVASIHPLRPSIPTQQTVSCLDMSVHDAVGALRTYNISIMKHHSILARSTKDSVACRYIQYGMVQRRQMDGLCFPPFYYSFFPMCPAL